MSGLDSSLYSSESEHPSIDESIRSLDVGDTFRVNDYIRPMYVVRLFGSSKSRFVMHVAGNNGGRYRIRYQGDQLYLYRVGNDGIYKEKGKITYFERVQSDSWVPPVEVGERYKIPSLRYDEDWHYEISDIDGSIIMLDVVDRPTESNAEPYTTLDWWMFCESPLIKE